MVHEIIEIKDNPFWKQDLDKSITVYEVLYETRPRLIVGDTFLQESINDIPFIERVEDTSNGLKGQYRGIPFEYDSGLTCVIVSGE